jgi:hypothetical protein
LLVAVVLAVAAAVPGGEPSARAQPPLALQPCPFVGTFCGTVTIGPNTPHPVYAPGNGRITTSPSGIDCLLTGLTKSGTCAHVFSWPASQGARLVVTFTVKPAPGSFIAGGSGTISQRVYLDRGTTVTFSMPLLLSRHDLSVTRTGAGTGRVVSSPSGIDCGGACTATFDYGSNVRLTATPAAGAVFRAWSGACAGQGRACTLKVTAATSTNAVFEVAPPPTTTTTPTTPTTTATTTTTQRDTSVDADLIAAKAGRSKLGARMVRAELDLSEDVAATLTLLRNGQALATKERPRVREGTRIVTLLVPATVAKGSATLVIELRDASSNTISWRRTLRIPPLKR